MSRLLVAASRLKLSAALPLATALALAAAGCGGEDPVRFHHLEYSQSSVPPEEELRAEFDARGIVLTEGTAASAHVIAKDSEGRVMRPLDLSSKDPSIMYVELGAQAGQFVFTGALVGETEIQVYIGDQIRGEVAASVVPQSAQ
jgi:hypothetical protein